MIYAMHQWETNLVQLFVIALLLQDSFGFNLNQKNMNLVKAGIQKRVMTKEMQPVLAIKEEWDNKTLEAAILKSQKGERLCRRIKCLYKETKSRRRRRRLSV